MNFLIALSQEAGAVSFGWAAAKMLAALIVVLGLAFVGLRYLLPRFDQVKKNAVSSIQILDRHPIAQRKAVYLLKIDNKKIAVAISEQNMTKLCEWEIESEGS